MSMKVELLVHNADRNDVIPVMLSSASGFRKDSQPGEFRKPLEWGVGETLALIGVVVAVAQLAVSIYEILRKSPGSSIELRRVGSAKESVVFEGTDSTPEEIARRIDEVIGHEKC